MLALHSLCCISLFPSLFLGAEVRVCFLMMLICTRDIFPKATLKSLKSWNGKIRMTSEKRSCYKL